ncbi:MAG: SIR2 family protein [Bacteroidia bacterium]|nr:SIR2 family protein [Bacteroidia bacterium]
MASFIILGAGFSYHAGLPLANGIRDYFVRNNAEKILKFPSGESRWVDFADEVYLNNGRLGFDHVAYGYILNTLVKRFTDARGGAFTNYEDMYQFWIDNLANTPFLDSVLAESKANCLHDKPHLNNNPMLSQYMYGFINTNASHLRSLVNHLIADLLFWRKSHKEFIDKYARFIALLEQEKEVTIVTLNHDRLLELILEDIMARPYSDGFTREQQVLKADNGKPLNVFQNHFDQPISIIKLHGSLDTYKYDCYLEQPDSATVVPTGEYMYFKTMDYYEKQHPERYDPASGEKVQSVHFEITPQFITGTNKTQLIASDKMYSDLFNKMDHDIFRAESMLLIGYSYGDQHVNDRIKEAIAKGKLKRITNVNPGTPFPFEAEGIEVVNLNDISELR